MPVCACEHYEQSVVAPGPECHRARWANLERRATAAHFQCRNRSSPLLTFGAALFSWLISGGPLFPPAYRNLRVELRRSRITEAHGLFIHHFGKGIVWTFEIRRTNRDEPWIPLRLSLRTRCLVSDCRGRLSAQSGRSAKMMRVNSAWSSSGSRADARTCEYIKTLTASRKHEGDFARASFVLAGAVGAYSNSAPSIFSGFNSQGESCSEYAETWMGGANSKDRPPASGARWKSHGRSVGHRQARRAGKCPDNGASPASYDRGR